MKYLSLLLLGSSLVAGLRIPGANQAKGLGKATGIGKANAKGAGAAAASNGQTSGNTKGAGAAAASSGQASGNTKGTGAAAASNGQASGNTKGTGTTASTGQSNGNARANGTASTNGQASSNAGGSGTTTSSAPGNAVSAANVAPGANPFLAVAGNNGNQFPTLTDAQKTGLQNAANLWAQDTAVVSSALSLLGSGQMSDQDFRDVADLAYMAEVNELMQKNYIDALLGTMPQLMAATTSLGNGSFAIVVDQLREMRIRGQSNQTFVQAAVQGMNNLRCRQVLLAIDTYVQTANQAAGNNSFISATRPPACQQVYAQTADTLPAGSVTNATTFPNAQQLITQFNQAPRFMLSNIVSFSQNSGNDNTAALGSQFSTNAPFSNTSSLAGQLLAFQGQPVQTNGDAANTKANPLNGVLFTNINSNQNAGNNNQNAGNSTQSTGATGQSGSNSQSGTANSQSGTANSQSGTANSQSGTANSQTGKASGQTTKANGTTKAKGN